MANRGRLGVGGRAEYFEFEGRDRWTCAAPGWEAVADHALEWAAKHARTTTRT